MDAPQKNPQLSRKVRLFGSVVIIAMLVGALISVIALREREIDDWRLQMGSTSLLLADHSAQTIAAAYLILDAVTERVRQAGVSDQASFRARLANPAVHEMLREKIRGLPQVEVASIVAANGDNINFSRSFPVPPINLAERDYFKAHLENPRLGDFISQPVCNKGNGQWTFYISRRLNDAQGRFMGLALVGISVDVLTRFYERVARNLGEGASISLFRSDLTLLTRWPHKNDLIGTVNRSGSAHDLIVQQKKSEGVILTNTPRFSSGEKVLRLAAIRTVERYPLIVAVIVSEDLFLSGWRRSAALIGGITAVGVLTLLIGLLVLVRNLERREADMVEMARLKMEAEAASLAKSRFLATMSHEIRTPMNGVLGMAQMLLTPHLRESDRHDFARIILSSGQMLLTLLNDILDFSKIEAGKFQLERSVFDPARLLHETQALFSGSARNKNLQIDAHWHGAPGQRYQADAQRVRQILANLVGNGIKFTAQGSIRIDGAEIERDGNSALLEFSVSDTGIGIPAEKLDLLFQPFTQGDSSITRQFGGSGLGLSIVRSLATLMGGSVGVDSEAGSGSRFWFRIRAGIVANGEDSRQAERQPVQDATAAAAHLPHAPTPLAAVKPLDRERLLVLVDEITPLLEQNKFDAIAHFKALQTLLAGTGLAAEIDELNEIGELLAAFRFDLALARLRHLAATQCAERPQ